MKVFNSNNPDGAAIQRDDEEFFAKSGRQYRIRHPHQSELDLFAQQGGKMRNPWPCAIVKRISADKHEVFVSSMTDTFLNPRHPANKDAPPPSRDPMEELQGVIPDAALKELVNFDEMASACEASSPGGKAH